MLTDYITSALATLLVVADPIFLSALFLGVTHGMGGRQRREVALRASIIALVILVAAGLGGAKLLDLLGISLSAFRIAGGLLLLSSAAEMVFDRRSQRDQATADKAISVDHVKNIAAFPLAIPLMAGPGAITAMILLAGRADGRVDYLGALFGVAMIMIKVRSPMLVAVGMYLPLATTFAIFVGGLFRWASDNAAKRAQLNGAQRTRVESVGILIASGLIAGEALMGLIVATLTFFDQGLPHIQKEGSYLVGLLVLAILGYVMIKLPLANAGRPDEPAPPTAMM